MVDLQLTESAAELHSRLIKKSLKTIRKESKRLAKVPRIEAGVR